MGLIYEGDLRAVVRMLAEVAAMDGGHSGRRDCVLTGLGDLVGADFWIWVLAGRKNRAPAMLDCAGRHASGVSLGMERARRIVFLVESITEEGGECAVLRSDPTGPAILHAREMWKGVRSRILLGRVPGREAFSGRECELAQIVLEEIPWLHDAESDSPEREARQLSGRQELVLGFLLEGMGRKQIADTMGISINTVAGYARDVYQRFGVRSQPELMRRFSGAGELQSQ